VDADDARAAVTGLQGKAIERPAMRR